MVAGSNPRSYRNPLQPTKLGNRSTSRLARTSGPHFNLLSVGVIGACSENRLFSSRKGGGRGEVLARIGIVGRAEPLFWFQGLQGSPNGLAEQRRVDPEHVNAVALDIHRP